jgi:hypothetical protein
MKRLWPWMYHFFLELRQKISSERKFQRPDTRQKQKFWVQQLADFLVYLFEIKRLVPSTIKGYRSAIGRTISILGGPDFGQNEYISLLVRNFSLEILSTSSCQKLRQARNSTCSRENVNLLPLGL